MYVCFLTDLFELSQGIHDFHNCTGFYVGVRWARRLSEAAAGAVRLYLLLAGPNWSG